jgi:hypothetical protein
VTVHGVGIVKVTPDVLDIVFGAEDTATSAKDALDTVGMASDAIVKLAKKSGVDKKDIQSTQINLSPNYDYSSGTSRVTGYTASVTIDVTLRSPSKAPGLLDDASAAAGDSLRLRGMNWSVDDPSKALSDARVAAMADAKDRASTLSRSAGASLGKVLSIAESSQSVAPPAWDTSTGGKESGAGSPVAIEAGTEQITVNVDVVYNLG